MPSPRKIAANRANAQRSTGPRSTEGKTQSCLNAFKHGLAIPVSKLPDLVPEVAHLAQLIAADAAESTQILQAATEVAEAAIDVMRVRWVRVDLVDRISRAFRFSDPPGTDEPMPVRPTRVRYTKAMYVRANLDGTHQQQLEAELAQMREELAYEREVDRIKQQRTETQQRAKDRRSQWNQLERLDRYERRALSRRNKAIKVFNQVKAVAQRGPSRLDTNNSSIGGSASKQVDQSRTLP